MSKKLAVMGADICLESIVNYLSDVEITVLVDNPNSDIFERSKTLNINCKYLPKEEMVSYFSVNNFDLVAITHYADDIPGDVISLGRFINIHPSLLPAFKGKDAMQMAFFAGVKVSGVTVHWLSTDLDGGKIIAQYPVLVGNAMHFDEFKNEIINLEKLLYPIVIDKLLKDEVFDFSDFLKGCGGSCNNCSGGCH